MVKTPLKVLEFKPVFTQNQRETIDFALLHLPKLWNATLNQLEILDKFSFYDKKSQSNVGRCPMCWEYKYYYLDHTGAIVSLTKEQRNKAVECTAFRETTNGLEWFNLKSGKFQKFQEKDFIKYAAPFSLIVDRHSNWYIKQELEPSYCTTSEGVKRAKGEYVFTVPDLSYIRGWLGGYGYSCPISYYQEPLIQSTKFTGKSSPSRIASTECLKLLQQIIGLDAEPLMAIHSDYRYGVIKGLCTSWNEYTKSRFKASTVNRGRPKYKRHRDTLNTLASGKSDTAKHTGKNTLILPGLVGQITVPNLAIRWRNSDGSIPKINTFKICRRVTGYYLQLTGEINRAPRLLNTCTVRAADPGVGDTNYLVFDDGERVNNPRFYKQIQEKLAKKQQQKDAKLLHNLILWLHSHNTTYEDIKLISGAVTEKKFSLIKTAKTTKELTEILGMSVFNRLKWNNPLAKSKAITKLSSDITRLHELAKFQRRAFIQKATTWHVRKNAVLILEDGMQKQGLKAKAKAKLNESGTGFDRNNAKAKSGLTKSLTDTGYGEYISQAERKAEEWGRKVIKYPARNTTKECPLCGHENNILLEQRWFVCESCKWEGDRDQKSGILMASKVLNGSVPDSLKKQLSDSELQEIQSLKFSKEVIDVASQMNLCKCEACMKKGKNKK